MKQLLIALILVFSCNVTWGTENTGHETSAWQIAYEILLDLHRHEKEIESLKARIAELEKKHVEIACKEGYCNWHGYYHSKEGLKDLVDE